MGLTESEKRKYFEYHNLNKLSIENAIKLIQRDLKNTYRSDNYQNEYIYFKRFYQKEKRILINEIRSYNRILLGLMVSWSDESIRRLLYEPALFTENQINFILGKPLDQKWFFSFKISFCIANSIVPISDETCSSVNISKRSLPLLSPDLIDKYDELRKLITTFLVPAFSIRNKVQHGEWVAAFKPPDSKEFDRSLTQKIYRENIVTVNARINIFNSVYQMIIDLARFKSRAFKIDVSTTPFEYFYKLHYKKIKQQKGIMEFPNLEKYIRDLISKEERGKMYRNTTSRFCIIKYLSSLVRRLF